MTARLMWTAWSYVVRLYCGAKSGYVWRMNIILYLKQQLLLWKQTTHNVTKRRAKLSQWVMTFPLIHTFLSILVTVPVSTASAERNFFTLRQEVAKVSSYKRQADEFGTFECSSWHTSRRRHSADLLITLQRASIALWTLSTIIMSRSPAYLNYNTNFRTLQCSKITNLTPFG